MTDRHDPFNRWGSTPDYLRAFDALYGRPDRSGFDRDRLPDPAQYYAAQLTTLRVGSNDWAQARCPFHRDRNPSLAVNLRHGGFLCFACGASGGDVLEFHRRLTGLQFREAAQDLGAWRGYR